MQLVTLFIKMWSFIVIFPLYYEVLCAYIRLQGPEYAVQNSTVLLNCSSDSPPYGSYAEFLVNGHSYTNIRRRNGQCSTGQQNLDCIFPNCSCSTTGLWYAMQYAIQNSSNNAIIMFKCVMKFRSSGQQSSNLRTIILDIKGPFIEESNSIPIVAGIQTNWKCKAFATNVHVDITLILNCTNLHESVQSKLITNPIEYISTLTFMPSSVHNGINCSCTLQAETYLRSTSIKLQVMNSPVLKLNANTECLSTLSVVLACEVTGELFRYGFTQWIHTFNGVIIRKLNGIMRNNSTSVIIKSCGYQDTGSYTCIAWNEYGMKTFWTNKTSVVKVLGPPVVVETHTIQDLNILLTAKFYSISQPIKIQWYLVNGQVMNASTINSQSEISILIYGNKIIADGYYTNISLENHKAGTYSVVIENEYGKTKQIFDINKKGYTYNLTVLLWILTGVGVFISTVTLTTLFTKKRNSGSFFTEARPVIYHAAPYVEPQVLPYDDIQDHPYDDCNADLTGASYYIDVIDGEDEITGPESSCKYEEID